MSDAAGFRLCLPLLVGLTFWQQSDARLQARVDLSLGVESHSLDEVDDELTSGIDVAVTDDRQFGKGSLLVDLRGQALADHANDRSNFLLNGNLFAEHQLFTPSLAWELDLQARQTLNIGPAEDNENTETDEFESETLTTVSTGPVMRLTRGLRGEIGVSLKAKMTSYEHSDLDSKATVFDAAYRYPINPSNSLFVGYEMETTSYDETNLQNQDNRVDRFSGGIQRDTDAFSYLISGGVDLVENDDSLDKTVVSLRADLNYQLNSATRMNLLLSQKAETTSEFDSNVNNDEDSLGIAGVVKTRKVEGSLEYTAPRYRLKLLGYVEQVENLADENSELETLKGGDLNFVRKLDKLLDLEASARLRFNDVKAQEASILSATLVYRHSRDLQSRLTLKQEKESLDNVETSDNILLYKIIYRLY